MLTTLYILYQYLIVLPIMVGLTILCALITIVCIPWKNAWWLNRIQAFWARMFCYLLFIPVSVQGLDNIRKGQSYVFVANHQSFFDIFTIYGWLPVVFKWLMKREIAHIPLVGTACRAAGHIYVDRGHAAAAAASIQAVACQLIGGISTVIFPEGTRTKDGQVGPFKRGAFLIAWQLGLPIIPIRLDGCYQVMDRSAKFATRHPITMTILPEVDLHQYASMEEAITAVRQMIVSA